MKLPFQHSAIRKVSVRKDSAIESAFTMVEIAICLAVIGFALVAIIGVLPVGMNVQKDNREETVINFDANYLMNAIRSGARGLDNLTNYVVAVTNISTLYDRKGAVINTITRYYTPTEYNDGKQSYSTPGLTNGFILLGLLCQPKYLYNSNNSPAGSYYSNYVTADIRALTGSPLDQGTAQASKDFAFTYRVTVETMPSADFPFQWIDTANQNENFTSPGSGYLVQTNLQPPSVTNAWNAAKNLQANLAEIRLRFRWPVLPGGKVGNGSQVYRSSVSGQITSFGPAPGLAAPPYFPTFGAPNYTGASYYYLIQPQSYTAAQ